MLDGRVLGASQVEYKPFGKPPLKREIPGMQGFPGKTLHWTEIFNTSANTSAICIHIPAAPSQPLYALNFNMSEYMSDEHVLGRLRLNSTRNSTRAAAKKWLVPVSSRALTRQPAESYGSYGSYGHTVIRLGTAPPCRACLA